MQFSFSISELVKICAPLQVEGDTAEAITGIASLAQARSGDLSFLGSKRYRAAVAESKASVVLVPADYAGTPSPNQTYLRVENPSSALGRICRQLEVLLWPRPVPSVHASAVIDKSARIGEGAAIGPFCVIETGATIGAGAWIEAGAFIGRSGGIGDNCRVGPGARVLAECVLGDRVMLHAGVVVGSDGFGYETVAGRHEKLSQVGNVIVGNDVEIGANSTIDRGRFSATTIGEGTKIDNLVQIGHNCVIGRHCILCSQVGLAGSTTLEDYVVMGGQSGCAGHLEVGKGSMIAGRTAIYSDEAPGSKLKGDPPMPIAQAQRVAALTKRLPEFFARLEKMEKKLGDSETEH
ncbi:MAG: UDP-3-O-(3-hydroxymyristoyl)glucosamine N-acyltransferase [Opitutaceae bacterium]